MQTFLQDNMVTTLFFGGVNIGERVGADALSVLTNQS
jgi:hypothetical protein